MYSQTDALIKIAGPNGIACPLIAVSSLTYCIFLRRFTVLNRDLNFGKNQYATTKWIKPKPAASPKK